MPGAFKAVFLDIGGTILEAKQPDEAYQQVLRDGGYDVTLDQVRAWLRSAREDVAGIRPPRRDDGTISAEQQERWRNAIVDAFMRLARVDTDAERFRAAISATWHGPQIFPAYPEALGVLTALKDAGLALGAISNWEPWLPELLANQGLGHLFDFVLASEAEGHVKPGRRLFDLALDRAGVEPHEALHVGDGIVEDVQAAEALGIRAVYVQRQTDKALAHAPRICSLDALVSIATARMLLRGTVERGKGEASGFTQIDWVREQVAERLGFDLYPGTLNVRLGETRDLAAWEELRNLPGVPLEPAPGYCAARCYPVDVEGQVAGAIVFPLVAGYPTDIVEVLAPVALREYFSLEEGTPVSLAVQ